MDNKKIIADRALLAQMQSGKLDALGQVFRSLRNEFISFMTFRFSELSKEDADEVFTDSCVSLYENVRSGKLKPDGLNSTLKTYLFQIGLFKALGSVRKHSKTEITADFPDTPRQLFETKFSEEVEEQHVKVYQWVVDLGEPCRSILEMYYYHTSTMTEIAEAMGYKSPDVAKNQKAKCLKRLRSNAQHLRL